MLVEGIKSRPVYTTLAARRGRLHLILTDDGGAPAVLGMVGAAPDEFLARAVLIHAPSADRRDEGGALRRSLTGAGTGTVLLAGDEDQAVAALRDALADARMGTQVYVAGTENLIARVVETALAAGLELGAIMAEHRGSHERRVQCVHCKAITEHVTTQPVRCAGCGLALLVRDHYSRRIGAFQGVCIDAEEPGTAPDPKALFA
jgi:NADPH-dependent ferric siderophore reductase